MTNETALAEAASGQDPAEGLRAARALRELAERLEALQVRNARARGWSIVPVARHRLRTQRPISVKTVCPRERMRSLGETRQP